MTPLAFAGARWLVPVAYILSIIHIGNGLLHISSSLLARRLVPGVLSAPLLLGAGCWLWYAAGQLGRAAA